MSVPFSRAEAWSLLCEWTESDSLRRHMLAVETGMRAYAVEFGEDEDLWGLTGLLHDLDYERYPDLETGHPRMALKELEERGAPPEMLRGIASHADFLGVSRDSQMEKTLFAVDELSGFITAVNRDELRQGADELGVDFDEHLAFLIAAFEPHAAELGLEGSAARST